MSIRRCGFCRSSAQPAATEDHSQTQKDGQQGPGDPVQGGFCTAGASEHGAAAGGQTSHAIALGAVQQHRNDQDDATDQKNAAEVELKKIITVKELRKELLKELNEDDESTEFKLCSELALNFGAYNLTKNNH